MKRNFSSENLSNHRKAFLTKWHCSSKSAIRTRTTVPNQRRDRTVNRRTSSRGATGSSAAAGSAAFSPSCRSALPTRWYYPTTRTLRSVTLSTLIHTHTHTHTHLSLILLGGKLNTLTHIYNLYRAGGIYTHTFSTYTARGEFTHIHIYHLYCAGGSLHIHLSLILLGGNLHTHIPLSLILRGRIYTHTLITYNAWGEFLHTHLSLILLGGIWFASEDKKSGFLYPILHIYFRCY